MATPSKTNYKYELVDLATDSTTIGHCILKKVRVHTAMSAHACPILDGSTELWSIPLSSAVGVEIDMGEVEVQNLVVDPDNAATGKVLVIYKPF